MTTREFALRQAEGFMRTSKDKVRVQQYLNRYLHQADMDQPLFRSVAELDRVFAIRQWLVQE